MPDLKKVIEIVFEGTDNLSETLNPLSKGLDQIESAVRGVTGPLADLSETTLKTTSSLALLGGAFLAVAVSDAVALQSGLAELDKQLGAGEGSANDYIVRLREIGDTYGTTTESAASAAAEFSKSGQEIASSLTLAGEAMLATQVSELSLEEATAFLLRTMSSFGLTADDMRGSLDSVNSVADNSQASFGELVRGMEILAPAAKQAGLSFEQMLAFLTPVVGAFGSGAESARGLRTVFLRLADPTAQITNTLRELGIAQRDANGELKPARELIEDLAKTWPTLSNGIQAQTASIIAGKDQSGKFLELMNRWPKALEAYENAVNKTKSATDEFARVQKQAGFQLQAFLSELKDTNAEIGGQFLVNTTGAVKAGTNLLRVFQDLVRDGALAPLFKAMQPFLEDFTATLENIARNLPEAFKGIDYGSVQDGFKNIGEAVKSLFGDIDINTAEGLEKAIQAIVDVGGLLLNVTSGIITSFGPFFQAIGQLAEKFTSLDSETQKTVGQILGFAQALEILFNKIGFVATTLGGIVLQFQNLKSGTSDLAVGWQLVEKSVNPIQSLFENVQRAIDALVPDLNSSAKSAENLGLAAPKAGEGLATIAESGAAANQAAADMAQSVGSATDAVKSHGEALGQTADEFEASIAGELALEAAAQKASEGLIAATKATDDLLISQGRMQDVVRDSSGFITKYTLTAPPMVEAEEKKKDALEKTRKELLQYEQKMEEIASNERIKLIEAQVSLEIANVEADAQKVVASFESITDVVTSSTALIGDLFDALAQADSWNQKGLIEKQLKIENQIRQEQLELQKAQTEAIIANLKAKTKKLLSGDALINIDASELYQETEAFMWAMLKAIRLRASEEGADFLLGLS